MNGNERGMFMEEGNNLPGSGQNEVLRRYQELYHSIEERFISQVESLGLPFNKDGGFDGGDADIKARLEGKGATFRNNGKSIHTGSISSACAACAKGCGCGTIYISLMCNRSCYYCFNPNQEEYEQLSRTKQEWRQSLSDWLAQEKRVTHLALTGGEPLLHKEDTLAFFQYVKEHLPGVHTRLYTAGDLLDEATLENLQGAGLQEIRFSVKLEDDDSVRESVLEKIVLAKNYIPQVMVEMPVIPGTGAEMRTLMRRLDEIGIYGINLLEFCFPLYNAAEFQKRGFMLKYPPFETLYNYWYAGGLAVDGSERLCLELVEFALDQGISMGVHYCCLENKYTGQIYKQNTASRKIPVTMLFSSNDYYIKTIKVFGEDIPKTIRILRKKSVREYEENKEYDYLQFHPRYLKHLKGKGIAAAVSYNVMEYREDGYCMRELKLQPLENGKMQFVL